MSVIVTEAGFAPEGFTGRIVGFEALWQGWDLPEDVALGVALEATDDPADLAPWFSRLALVVVPFATHADGRGFGLARRLREAGYAGRIRARGPLLPDQFRAARRAGIDEVEIDAARARRMPEAQWRAVGHGPDYRARLFGRA